MKKKMFILIIVLFIITILASITYYYIRVATSSIPKDIFKKYGFRQEKFLDRDVFILKPKEKESELTILYIHGGSYVGELEKLHWDFFKDIINDTNATIIVPDYPLAPANEYTDVFEIMIPLYKEIVEKVDISKFVLMGDSAGGGLALGLYQTIGEEDVILPQQTILISPWLDVRMENPQIDNIDDPILNKSILKIAGQSYAGKNGMESYQVNPVLGPTDKFNNIYILTGTRDILNPDAKLLAKRSNINLFEFEGAIHNFALMKNRKELKKAHDGYNKILEILQKIGKEGEINA